MDEDNRGLEAGASRSTATSSKAKKRRRDSSPQEEASGESSRSKRKPTPSSQPTPPLLPNTFPLWPPGNSSGSTAPPTIPMVPYPYMSTTHHQPFLSPPAVVWSPMPATPASVHRDIPTRTGQTRLTEGPTIASSVNYDLASVSVEEHRDVPFPVNASSGSQQHPNSGVINNRPRLEDLPDPPVAQRPLQTIQVLASAALRSEPKGRLTLEEVVDKICSRFEYFQVLENRTKLKNSVRHALSLYSDFQSSDDLENRTARKVWHLTAEVPPNKYVRKRKRKSRRTTVPHEESDQEEQVHPERENAQDVVEESNCIDQSDEIEIVGIVRAGEKEKTSRPESSHAAKGVQVGEKLSLATPEPLATKPKLKRVLHGAEARSVIDQILAEKESDDGNPKGSRSGLRSASPDESPPSIRLQPHRWGMTGSSQNTTPSTLLQTPTTQPSHPSTRSAFGGKSTSSLPPGTNPFVAAAQPSSSTGFGYFANFGTPAFGSFSFVQAPSPSTAPPSLGTELESGQPDPDGDES